MSLSSTGAKSSAPPHTMHPFVFLTTFCSSGMDKLTGASTSMESAVPAALVMLLELVLGIRNPALAMMGTTIMLALPLVPPMQCLSSTGLFPNDNCFPLAMSAFVMDVVSSSSIP